MKILLLLLSSSGGVVVDTRIAKLCDEKVLFLSHTLLKILSNIFTETGCALVSTTRNDTFLFPESLLNVFEISTSLFVLHVYKDKIFLIFTPPLLYSCSNTQYRPLG